MEQNFLLTYTIDSIHNYNWFETEEEMNEFIGESKDNIEGFDIIEAIEILDCRKILP